LADLYLGWGRNRRYHHHVVKPLWMHELDLPSLSPSLPLLAYGLGRSYGDACLNADGILIDTSNLRRMLSFDEQSGILHCESGVSLGEIIEVFLPKGWFPTVVPGTKYVTVGGAIAHDIHGKNHHRRGSFGCHVTEIELIRGDGQRLVCSATTHSDLFAATIGGMGLTGFIATAKIKLIPVTSASIDCENIRMTSFDDYQRLTDESERDFEYTVAWIDSTARDSDFGRGIFMRGNHTAGKLIDLAECNARRAPKINFPFETPISLVNELSTPWMNRLFYKKQFSPTRKFKSDYNSYFFPLDAIGKWNQAFGKRGFFQYQFVVPDIGAVREALQALQRTKLASFVTVLKSFGRHASPGLMSFPFEGPTLTLDIPDVGSSALKLFDELDTIVTRSGGRIYTAKDARMPASVFRAGYPKLDEFRTFVDPRFSSSLWRRLNE
jgi:FAD/FMN-containing dehydrogenase